MFALLFACAVWWQLTDANTIYFKPGQEYRFNYRGTSQINGVGTFQVNSKVGIVALGGQENMTQHCLLFLHDFHVRVRQEPHTDQAASMSNVDFSQWLSFDIDAHGHIDHVYYDAGRDDLYAVEMKKKILGVLSNKLVVSEEAERDGTRWAYSATEHGHEGVHGTEYQAEPDNKSNKITFTKRKRSLTTDSMDQSYRKIVHLDRQQNIPRHSELYEGFATLQKPRYQSSIRGSEQDIEQMDKEYAFPVIKGQGMVSMIFDKTVASESSDVLWKNRPSILSTDTLQAHKVLETLYTSAEAHKYMAGNISCILTEKTKQDRFESNSKMHCFHQLCNVMARMTFDNLQAMVNAYQRANITVWTYVVDALGATQTNDTLFLLTDFVLSSDMQPFNVTMAALAQVIYLRDCPLRILPDKILERVLRKPWQYDDEHQTKLVNDRTLLVLGSLANRMRTCNKTWADDVTRLLQDMTGLHDPYSHRVTRSAMSRADFKSHVARKSLQLAALGNDGSPSSFHYFKSYLNDTTSHIQLRCNAVLGIKSYKTLQGAETLLNVALTDPHNIVKSKAADAYTDHPHGGDIRHFLATKQYRYSNISDVEHRRMRRSLAGIASRIWEGFQFRLATPSLDWQKTIGGSQLGMSMGVIVKNFLEVDIAPLAASASVNIQDKAFLTAHLGIIGIDHHFFLAEVCYKGHISYDINTLAESTYGEAVRIAEQMDRIVNQVVNQLNSGVRNFKNLLTDVNGFDVTDIIDSFVTTVKTLPNSVFDIRKIARRLFQAMDEFTVSPPVFVQIRGFVQKITKIFNDVKSDIMTFYNAIVDTVMSTLPWAWKEIMNSFNGMVAALANVLQNPLTSIQNLGRGVARISLAIGVILEAKDTIVSANIFAAERRPYWFDFAAVLDELREDMEAIEDALDDTSDWLLGRMDTEKSLILEFTGVTTMQMKWQMLRELWSQVVGNMGGPFLLLDYLLDPFLATYELVTDTITRIKDGWATLVENYNKARSQIEAIFGPKFHKKFPGEYFTSSVCGDGFWESTGSGRYSHPGVDLKISVNHVVVAPFGGEIRLSGPQQVTIDIKNMRNMEIIIDNIDFATNITNRQVGAGDYIGRATRPWCSEGHIHVAMRDTRTLNYVDPSRFKSKRKLEGAPEWIEDCDHYQLIWQGLVLQEGNITPDPASEDQTPSLQNAPDVSALQAEGFMESTSKRKKRSIADWLERFHNFTVSLGLGDITDLRDLFSLRLNDLSVETLLGAVSDAGNTELESTLSSLLEKIQELSEDVTCARPESMDDHVLRANMFLRGQSTSGSRAELEARFRHPDTDCDVLADFVSDEATCIYAEDCLGLSCCVDLELFGLFHYPVLSYISFDRNSSSLTLGVDNWFDVVTIPETNDFEAISHRSLLSVDRGYLDMKQLIVNYVIAPGNFSFQLHLSIEMCSTLEEECTHVSDIFRGLEFPTDLTNQAISQVLRIGASSTVGDMLELVDLLGLSEEETADIINEMRDVFAAWLNDQIHSAVTEIFENVLDLEDICMRGYTLEFGPNEVPIFQANPSPIPLGWFLLFFEFGLSGYFGAQFHCDMCMLSMQTNATITPYVGAITWGSMSLALGPFQVRLLIEGHVITTEMPTTANVIFQRFPLDVKARMGLKLVPLHVFLYGQIVFEIEVNILGVTVGISETLLSVKLWEYESEQINKEIFNAIDAEPDDSPPSFLPFEDNERRRKREGSGQISCTVEQVAGKDYTEPAFNIQYDVADDRSDVETILCIGTYHGGCDVLSDEPLSGTASLQSRALRSGVPLYFTVTSRNSQGGEASITCDLITYDTTPPTGRVTAEFTSTSHPNIIKCLMFVTDDSEIVTQMVSAGHGTTMYGTQMQPWEEFEITRDSRPTSDNTESLSFYAVPKTGRLIHSPFETMVYQYAEQCAQECQSYPLTRCLGFNYDYGSGGWCELLDMVEGQAEVQTSGSFHYFERLGVGHTGRVERRDLNLVHNSLVYCNVHIENALGYTSFLSSEAVMVDFTPPDPGSGIQTASDMLLWEACTEYTPEHLDYRCVEQTPSPNFRFITDVPYSNCTVCNGHEPGEELLWTRSNRMVSCHWDHIHDNETGILIYTWSVGTEPCEDNVHPHTDPHAHIHKESEWTNQASEFPLNLDDGLYHITVTALNEVGFGGPLALQICHSTPYIIDTTPPVIYHVEQAMYDVETEDITMNFTAGDDLSGLQYQQIGLGTTTRDTYTSPFTTVPDSMPALFNFLIPDGIPTWVKVRVANNVDLRTMDHSPRALFLDNSPPLAGDIYMGRSRGAQEFFQYQSSELCANWQDFYDPESGISEFVLTFGTTPGGDDVMEPVSLSADQYEFCRSGLVLDHNTLYYAGFMAINGATNAKNVTAASSGILVDTTPPVTGSVKDGSPDTEDLMYSSNAASIAVTWTNFSDPESGLDHIQVSFIKEETGSEDTILHAENDVSGETTSLEFHHFYLHHGDVIYTEVDATNRAGLSTLAASNGFLVDLTDPVMNALVDGTQSNNDIQYSSSLTSLSARWRFSDEDSGIASYETAVFTTANGLTNQFYPQGSMAMLDGGEVGWDTGDALELTSGHFYFTRVVASNGAGLTAVADTDGVIIDATPPQMTYVHVGVLSGASEETIGGYFYQNNPLGILASWKAVDYESGITSYVVGIGTAPEQDDVGPYTGIVDEDGFLDGLSLNLTDTSIDPPSPLYYITVKSLSGAGQYSTAMTSSPVILVEEDQAGLAWDGTGDSIASDIDYQLSAQSIAIAFSGFESALHGIRHYEWAVGTQPRLDDVMGFTDYGIIITDESSRGLGSEGFAQAILSLQHGQRYYTTVRAITGVGNVMDVSTDGVMVDTTAAITSIVLLRDDGAADQDHVYQRDSALEAQWTSTEEEGHTNATWVAVGTVPGGSDVYSLQETSETHLSADAGLNTEGKPNFITIITQNQVGLTSVVTSTPVLIDNSPPTEGRVECPIFASAQTIQCSLWDFVDNESGISHFEVALGVSEGDRSVSDFSEISAGADDFSITFQWLENFGNNQQYYVTVKAVNYAQLSRTVFSDAIFIDNTPPVGGSVMEVLDHEVFDTQSLSHILPDSGSGGDATCQRDLTRVHIMWDAFTDHETGIDHYDIALGTSPGGAQVTPFRTIDASYVRYVFSNLNLADVATVYASVRAYNKAGLHTTLTSNGVHISRLSAGLNPLQPLEIYDGQEDRDLDFQNNIDGLGATWRLSGEPCTMTEMRWTILRFDDDVTNPEEVLPDGLEYAFADELQLNDRQSFYIKFSAVNELNYTVNLHSDGITIKLEPVLPGTVRDGIILGVDLSYQSSNTTIGCHWSGFGDSRTDGTFNSILEDTNNEADIETGESQAIDHYEVAIGTDRSSPSTRSDIRPFIDVGRNESWLFEHLSLESGSSIYYCTVRAFSVSTASTEVTSNGIKVGYGGQVIQHGTITLDRYIASASRMSLSWSGFEFSTPVLRYYWGIATGRRTAEEYDCQSIILDLSISGAVGDAYPLEDVALDTYVAATELTLEHAADYTVIVIAVDESGTCDLAVQTFTVDVTSPTEGRLLLENSVDLDVLYNDQLESLHVTWEGFDDPESGMETFMLSLYSSRICTPDIGVNGSLQLIAEDTLPQNSTDYTFMEVDLQYDTVYYVSLMVQNGATLRTTVMSRPILVDIVGPSGGKVVDGLDIQVDAEFQSSTTQVSGSLLYIPSSTDACSSIIYSSYVEHDDFVSIVHKGMLSVPEGEQDNVYFLASQVDFLENYVTLTMDRRLSEDKVKSGAVALRAGITSSGIYRFQFKASNMDWAATCIALWDGHPGVFPCPSSMTSDANNTRGFITVLDALEGDTYPEGYRLESVYGHAFGLKVRITDDDGSRKTEVTIWGETGNELRESTVLLDIDASDQAYTYELSINEGRELVEMHDWDIKLYIGGLLKIALGGIHGVALNGSILIGLVNNDGFIPEAPDEFNPPSTQTFIHMIEIPPSDDIMCFPFRGGDHPIVEFHAGIGSMAWDTDIVPFQTVHIPPIPCGNTCDDLLCDPSVNEDDLQIIHFTLSDLNLEPIIDDVIAEGDSALLQQAYFLTVKGLTGSGREALATSTGFYIDTTPPIVNRMLHFDTAYNSFAPVRYQGNNHTIRVIFNVEDLTSGIVENWWAIGTAPNMTDVQDFVSVGTAELASSSGLGHILENHRTYYVTVKSLNGAGLVSYNSSEGVTILLDTPSVENTTSRLPGTTGIGSENTNAVRSSTQDNFTIEFDTPPPNENINSIKISAGSGNYNDNIFPSQQVGYNVSARISITGNGLSVNNGGYQDLNASRGMDRYYQSDQQEIRKKRSADDSQTQLLMEPGRSLHITVEVCNEAHLCANLPSLDIMVVRDSDMVVGLDDSSRISADLEADLFDEGMTTFNITTPSAQTADTFLMMGYLSEQDTSLEYKSDASDTFSPMVVNPRETMGQTNRNLYGRISFSSSRGLFISALPGEPVAGPVTARFDFDPQMFEEHVTEPSLLAYCAVEQVWVVAGESCRDSAGSHIDWLQATVELNICDLEAYCADSSSGARRRKRETEDGNFSGSHAFTLAAVSTEYVNYPPILTSDPNIQLTEDEGTVIIQLTGADPELDQFEFLVAGNNEARGNMSLTAEGELTYRPCDDCFGQDIISIILREVRTDEIAAAESYDYLNVTLEAVNDSPRIVVMQDGDSLSDEENQVYLTVEEHVEGNGDNYTPLEILVGAYDVDEDDVNIFFGTVDNGDVTVENQEETDRYELQDCTIEWKYRKEIWKDFEKDLKHGTSSLTVIIPCDMNEEVDGKTMQWTLSLIRYSPQVDFYGVDNLRVNAKDTSAARLTSELMNITIYVLANPCLNGASCVGPETDPECTSLDRLNGFDGYSCDCQKGFKGKNCETNIDDCDPNRCKDGYKCIDKINGYDCECEKGPCLLTAWAIALIVVSIVAVLAVVAVSLVCWFYARKKHRNSENSKLLNKDETGDGSENIGFDDPMLDDMPDSAAPVATTMRIGEEDRATTSNNRHRNANTNSLKWTLASSQASTNEEGSYEMSEASRKSLKGGRFSTSKQSSGLHKIKVKPSYWPVGGFTLKPNLGEQWNSLDPERNTQSPLHKLVSTSLAFGHPSVLSSSPHVKYVAPKENDDASQKLGYEKPDNADHCEDKLSLTHHGETVSRQTHKGEEMVRDNAKPNQYLKPLSFISNKQELLDFTEGKPGLRAYMLGLPRQPNASPGSHPRINFKHRHPKTGPGTSTSTSISTELQATTSASKEQLAPDADNLVSKEQP